MDLMIMNEIYYLSGEIIRITGKIEDNKDKLERENWEGKPIYQSTVDYIASQEREIEDLTFQLLNEVERLKKKQFEMIKKAI